MRKIIYLIFFLITIINEKIFVMDIYENYAKVSGEGPVGQYVVGFKTKTYSKEDAISLAKREIFEFLTGLIYGYNFKYKVENNVNKQKGYFELTPIASISEKDKSISLTQSLEKQDAVKILAIYRLNENQKSYIRAFNSSVATFTVGEGYSPFVGEWDNRLISYREAIKNSILNDAKTRLKARPLFIKGKIFLKESPSFTVVSGEWRCVVKVHIMVTEVKYEDVF